MSDHEVRWMLAKSWMVFQPHKWWDNPPTGDSDFFFPQYGSVIHKNMIRSARMPLSKKRSFAPTRPTTWCPQTRSFWWGQKPSGSTPIDLMMGSELTYIYIYTYIIYIYIYTHLLSSWWFQTRHLIVNGDFKLLKELLSVTMVMPKHAPNMSRLRCKRRVT